MPLYLKIALRYLRAKKSTNAINVISWITIVTMALGTLVMITLMSVFNGFEALVVDMFNVFYADIKVSPEKGKYLTITEDQLAEIKSIDGVLMLSTVLEEDALLEYGEEQFVATVRGVQPNYFDIIDLDSTYIINGTLELEREGFPRAILGRGVRQGLGVNMYNPFAKIKVNIPRKDAGSSSFENAFNFNMISPSGEFNIQQEFDERYVLVPQSFVQNIRGSTNDYSALELKIRESVNTNDVSEAIAAIVPGVKIQNRFQQNSTLYNVMRAEKWVFFAILTLILIIVSFSITGTLSMLIVEKKKDIAVLRALGATTNTINKIFLAEGVMMAFRGVLFGIVGAFVLCSIQQYIGLVRMPGQTFVVEFYPVKMKFFDFLAATVVIFLISFFASYLPTRRAAKNVGLSEMMRAE
ncbi:MAG: ABC transporter permease [Bacteroidetes bacterium]|nr:ABC transporter permease [Bacteroidota bacterium]